MWEIEYSAEADADLNLIYEYVAQSLTNTDAAKRILRMILTSIDSLSQLPERHANYPCPAESGRAYRYFPVENYLIFYEVVPSSQKVRIVRIMFKSRNISSHLG